MAQQVRPMASALMGLWILLAPVEAWPSQYNCDYVCMEGETAGGTFGHMGIDNYGPAPTGANCEITTDIPVGGYASGGTYAISVSSTVAVGRKLVSNVAGFAGNAAVDDGAKVTTFTKSWTATSDASASFIALCGAGGAVRKIWVADKVTVNLDATAPVVTPTPTPTPTPSPTPSPSPSGSAATVELLPGMTLSSTASGGNVQMSVVSDRIAWAAVGFPSTNVVSMTGEGKGADLFACTNGEVKRYWLTSKSPPSGGVAVTGSTCAYVNGKTTMTFSRTVAAQGANTVAVTPGTCQTVIFARGVEGSSAGFAIHVKADRDGKNVNLQDTSQVCGAVAKKSAETALWMHMICMLLCFGTLLPWGVALANRTRGASPAGSWFKLHKGFQYTGWCLQIIGFAMAIWHAGANAGGHFGSANPDAKFHTFNGLFVVILTTQQPLNAFVRPHPVPGQPKSTGRWIFEIVHKGSGYTAVLLGVFNCFSGAMLVNALDYDSTVMVVALVLLCLGVVPVLSFVGLTCCKQDNIIARMCLGLVGGKVHVDQETGNENRPPVGDVIGSEMPVEKNLSKERK